MGFYLNQLLFYLGKTLELRTELGDQVSTTTATLRKDYVGFYLDNFESSKMVFTRIDELDLTLGMDIGERVRVFYRNEGSAKYDFVRPNFYNKQRLPGMINAKPKVRRIERI